MLLEEVWNYKFVPQTNLVDVHMGRLRRKVGRAARAADDSQCPAVWASSSVRLPDFGPHEARFAGRSPSPARSSCTPRALFRLRLLADGYLSDFGETIVLLAQELRVFRRQCAPRERLEQIDDRLSKDPRHVKVAGLFAADGRRIAGNIESLPPGLAPDVPGRGGGRSPGRRQARESESKALPPIRLPSGGSCCDRPQHRRDRRGRRKSSDGPIALGLPAAGVRAGGCDRNGAELAGACVGFSDINRQIPTYRGPAILREAPARPRGSDDPFEPARPLASIGCWARSRPSSMRLPVLATASRMICGTPLTRVRVRLERGGARHASTLEQSRAVADQGDRRSRPIVGHHHGPVAHRRDRAQAGRLDKLQARSGSAPLLARGGRSPMSRSPRISVSPFGSKRPMKRRCTATAIFSSRLSVNLVDNAVKFTPEGGTAWDPRFASP